MANILKKAAAGLPEKCRIRQPATLYEVDMPPAFRRYGKMEPYPEIPAGMYGFRYKF